MRNLFYRWYAPLLCLLLASLAAANPSDKQPHAALDVHGQQFSPALLDTAQKLAEKNRVAIEKFQALAKDNEILEIDPLELGVAHANSNRLQRAAEQLIVLGEPAGIDYQFRATEQNRVVQQMALSLQAIPQAAQGISVQRNKAAQTAQAKQKELPKLVKLIERKDWEAAEQELYEALDAIDVFAIYLDSNARASIYAPWDEVRRTITLELTASRQSTAEKLLAERSAAARADLSKLVADIEAAATTLAKADKHTVDDKPLTGPELIAHFDAAWQQAHLATMKALALEWARAAQAGDVPTTEWQQLRADHDQFAAAIGPALAKIIAADTARASAASVPALYQAYLPVVADLVDHSAGALESDLQAALQSLAAKSPELAANVAAYHAVTADLLRWRARVATEQAQSLAADYPAAATPTHAAFQRNLESPGLFEPQPLSTAKARLNAPAGRILSVGSPKLIGQKVMVGDWFALAGSQARIARFHDRLYARLTLPADALASQVAALEGELMVTEQQPPLTLAATRAVRGARRGDLVQAGGTVGGVFLEGYVTRFVTLPDAAALLVPLGQLPPDHREPDQLHQVALRLDVQPQWVQQRYFLVRLRAP